MSIRKPQIVVTRRPVWFPWLLVGLWLVTLLLAGLGAFYLADYLSASRFHQDRTDAVDLRGKEVALSRQLQVEQAKNHKLSNQLAYAERSGQIDGEACAIVKKSLAGMQQEESGLREQLAFYRGIASPHQSSQGLRVYDFKLSPDPASHDAYDFALLLIQPMHHHHLVTGQAFITVSGLQAAHPRSYRLAQLLVGGRKSLLFSFKYFQELDGRIQLPPAFNPLRVRVSLRQGKHRPPIEESFDWSKVEQSAGVKR